MPWQLCKRQRCRSLVPIQRHHQKRRVITAFLMVALGMNSNLWPPRYPAAALWAGVSRDNKYFTQTWLWYNPPGYTAEGVDLPRPIESFMAASCS